MGFSIRQKSLGVAALLILVTGLALEASAQNVSRAAVPLIVPSIIVRPGRPFVLSVRTCQPRGISEGEILLCRPERPMSTVVESTSFSREDDVTISFLPCANNELGIQFESPSASLNTWHGPMFAFLMDPEIELEVGESLPITIDSESTYLLDDAGEEARFDVIPGTMTVCAEDDPFVLGIEPSQESSSHRMTAAISTYELVRLSRADLVVHYDAVSISKVRKPLIWDLNGDLLIEVDDGEPGILRITLESPSGTLNKLPGPMVELDFSLDPGVESGTTALVLDPAETHVYDSDGNPLELEFRNGLINTSSRSSR